MAFLFLEFIIYINFFKCKFWKNINPVLSAQELKLLYEQRINRTALRIYFSSFKNLDRKSRTALLSLPFSR